MNKAYSTIKKDVGKSNIARFILITFAVVALLAASIIAGILLGAADLSAEMVFRVLISNLFGIYDEGIPSPAQFIVWDLRLPRVLLAIAVGGGLAICGAAMQAVTQNVLADPYILGVSSGASAMVSFVFFIGGAMAASRFAVSAFAFSGAFTAMMLVLAIGRMGGGSSSGTRLILSGMAINVMLGAVAQLFITLSTAHTARNITMWMMGSVGGGRWNNIAIPIIVSIFGLLYFCANARAYNLISLGDETAISMGINAARVKRNTTIVVAFVTGIIVANVGLIGLVGFIIPHIVRLLVGPNHRLLFPLAFIVGAVFLVWMDMLARYVMAPAELPVGLFTAMCGGPFFIWLLTRQARGERG